MPDVHVVSTGAETARAGANARTMRVQFDRRIGTKWVAKSTHLQVFDAGMSRSRTVRGPDRGLTATGRSAPRGCALHSGSARQACGASRRRCPCRWRALAERTLRVAPDGQVRWPEVLPDAMRAVHPRCGGHRRGPRNRRRRRSVRVERLHAAPARLQTGSPPQAVLRLWRSCRSERVLLPFHTLRLRRRT